MSEDQKTTNSRIRIEDKVLKGAVNSIQTEYTNLGKFVLDILESDEDFVGQVDPSTDEECSYGRMRERSVRCALWMKSQGLGVGDVVAISSHNQPDITTPCFAALYIGAIFNPLDAGMIARDFRHLLNIIKPKMVFANEKSASVIAEVAEDLELELKIVVFGNVTGFVNIEDVISEPSIERVKNFKITDIVKAEEPALVVCSSGTTGLPKGVTLSHKAILNSLFAFDRIREMKNATSMIFSNIYWLSGTSFVFLNLLAGMRSVIAPPFEEHTACSYIEKYKVNMTMLTPTAINRLIKFEALSEGRYDISSLRWIFHTGSPLRVASVKSFAKYVPNAVMLGSYGMTECGSGITRASLNPKPGSSGRIVNNAQLKVIDPQTGRLLGTNELGEFCVKTAAMMTGYYNDPQATAMVFDEEGFLRTGDLGYYDEDGEIFVVDRLKELIKYCNYQISPNEIESVILSHPGVKEAVVVGLPHPEDGEHPIAFVVKSADQSDPNKQVTESDLVDLVAAELSQTKRLRGGVKFVDDLPKSPSDKVLRKIIRDMAKAMV